MYDMILFSNFNGCQRRQDILLDFFKILQAEKNYFNSNFLSSFYIRKKLRNKTIRIEWMKN